MILNEWIFLNTTFASQSDLTLPDAITWAWIKSLCLIPSMRKKEWIMHELLTELF